MLDRTEQNRRFYKKVNKSCHAELVSASCQLPSFKKILKRVQDDVKRESFMFIKRLFNFSTLQPFTLSTRFAFTLAEVLIVVGILGLVAEMTIPTLVQNTQEKVTVVSLKKAYSVFSQAYTLAVNDNGTPDTWNLGTSAGDSQGAINMINMLAPYLRITKNCGTGSDCMPDKYKNLNGTDKIIATSSTNMAKAALSDGTIMYSYTYGGVSNRSKGGILPLLKSYGEIDIDVNGLKGPNVIGKDFFFFILTNDGIVPMGLEDENTFTFGNDCNLAQTGDIHNGWGCAAWVIYNENMDYLKCNNLSWDGPTKCN